MLCQNCGKNEANVRYTQIINGEKKELILCEKCAQKLGINNFNINIPIHFSSFLDDFFEDDLMPSYIKNTNNKCEICGEMYDDFINTGLLGCTDCYDVFEDRLDSVLKNIQGATRHIGRKPINIAEKMKNIGENLENNKINNNKKEKNSNSKNIKEDLKLEELEKELEKSIKEERYEDAAILRDKINLKKKEK